MPPLFFWKRTITDLLACPVQVIFYARFSGVFSWLAMHGRLIHLLDNKSCGRNSPSYIDSLPRSSRHLHDSSQALPSFHLSQHPTNTMQYQPHYNISSEQSPNLELQFGCTGSLDSIRTQPIQITEQYAYSVDINTSSRLCSVLKDQWYELHDQNTQSLYFNLLWVRVMWYFLYAMQRRYS